jgi:hypothetical protein
MENRQRFENDMPEITPCKAEFQTNAAPIRSPTARQVSPLGGFT